MVKRALPLYAAVLFGLLTGATSALAKPGLSGPGQVEFGSIDIHFGGQPRQSVQLMNTSEASIAVGSIALNGRDAAHFEVVNDGCSNQELTAMSSCSLEVGFQPGTAGPRSATLEVPYSQEGSPEGALDIPVAGVGTTGTISASPGSLTFSPIPYTRQGSHEGEQNETEQVTVLDSANAGTQLESVSIAGPDAASFSIQYGNCEHDLMGPNNSCDEGVAFQPTSPGQKHALLLIAGDSANGPLAIPLEGTGVEGPELTVPTRQALLGDVALGSFAQQSFPVVNTGDYPLYIEQLFLISGTPLMFPITTDTCSGQILAPSASCTVAVDFAPTLTGEKDASIVIVANTTPSINVLGIDGNGVPLGLSSAPPTPLTTAGTSGARTLSLMSGTRSLTASGGRTVNTGVTATCPPTLSSCQALSLITTRRSAHAAKAGSDVIVLGTSTVQLRGGASAKVHIRLTPSAVALLRRHRHLRVTITTIMRGGGKALAQRSQTLRLHAPSAPARRDRDATAR